MRAEIIRGQYPTGLHLAPFFSFIGNEANEFGDASLYRLSCMHRHQFLSGLE